MTFDPTALGRLGITEEQVELMDVAENFCREKSDIAHVRGLLTSDHGFESGLWTEVAALGWLGIAVPEEFDGVGLSLAEVVPVIEQMGRRMMGLPIVPTSVAAQAILAGGTDAQKMDVLPKIVEGAVATLALSEINGSYDLTEIETVATRSDAGYTLSGQKILVQNLDSAQFVILSAKLDGKVSLFLIETDLISADKIRREKLIDETKRSYEVTLEGLTIPGSALMNADKVAATLEKIDLVSNLLGSAEMVGGAQACIDYTVDYLTTRKQFGKLIGAYQALKHPTVDAYIGYEKARSLLYAAANSFNEQGQGEIAIRMARVASGRALSYAADRSIQFHGGFGFTYDCDAQLYRRRAIFHDSQYGDIRWHKAKLADLLFS